MSQRKGIFLIITFLVLVALVFLSGFQFQTTARKMLPKSANEVMEFRQDYLGFTADYWYALKAKISKQEFKIYSEKMKFIIIPEDKKERFYIAMSHEGIGDWWDPNEDSEVLYYDPTMIGSGQAIMKYEKGYLYYRESSGY